MNNNLKLGLLLLVLILTFSAKAQKESIELTFTAENNGSYAQLDSIRVLNKTQNDEFIIHWPDTSIIIDFNPGDLMLFIGYSTFPNVGLQDYDQESSRVHLVQNYPNPVINKSIVALFVPEDGNFKFVVSDAQGMTLIAEDYFLPRGHHRYQFTPGRSLLYFLSVHYSNGLQTIKILSPNTGLQSKPRLVYTDGPLFNEESNSYAKSIPLGNAKESGSLDTPSSNRLYTFQFATNIPCPGNHTVDYEGQTYNTIQIFSQCWLKENLNVGVMIEGNENMTDNGIIEKYCYNNEPDSCAKHGGLYQWNEIMQYGMQSGTRGICPPGWHIPTNEEIRLLEGSVDSQYGIGDIIWDELFIYRGFDSGKNLKTTSGWELDGNGLDLFGFSAIPVGRRYVDGSFMMLGDTGLYWSSDQQIDTELAFHLSIFCLKSDTYLGAYGKLYGISLRCLKDFE